MRAERLARRRDGPETKHHRDLAGRRCNQADLTPTSARASRGDFGWGSRTAHAELKD